MFLSFCLHLLYHIYRFRECCPLKESVRAVRELYSGWSTQGLTPQCSFPRTLFYNPRVVVCFAKLERVYMQIIITVYRAVISGCPRLIYLLVVVQQNCLSPTATYIEGYRNSSVQIRASAVRNLNGNLKCFRVQTVASLQHTCFLPIQLKKESLQQVITTSQKSSVKERSDNK